MSLQLNFWILGLREQSISTPILDGPQEFTLSSLQVANPPDKTLIEMREGEQNRVLEKVANQLTELLNENLE
jgi:hypothetical protein